MLRRHNIPQNDHEKIPLGVWDFFVSYPLAAVPIWSVTDGTRGVSNSGSALHVCAVKTVRWNGRRVHLDR